MTSTAADIYQELAACLGRADHESMIERADHWWDEIRDLKPTADGAEVCRQLYLAFASVGNSLGGARWRARATSIAARIPWRNGIAALLLPAAFELIEFERFDEARLVLDEMPNLADESEAIPLSGVSAEQ